MRRAMTIALLTALVLQSPFAGMAASVQVPPPPPGFRIVEQEPEWPGQLARLAPPFDYIDIGDWTSRGVGGTELTLLTQAARQPNHIWVRWEYLAPSNGVRSARDLVEVDCETWRTRIVQHTTFSRANLAGLIQTVDVPQTWSAQAPGTLGELVLETACAD